MRSDQAISIEAVAAITPQVRELIYQLDQELAARYPPQQRHGLTLDALLQPHVRFFVASVGDEPVGCGGVALFATFAEIKRMYVRPEMRGQGVADTILARLTDEAAAAGLSALRLETGVHQHAAIRFYRRSGFELCPAFEPYTSLPPSSIATSVFMEKRIGPGAAMPAPATRGDRSPAAP